MKLGTLCKNIYWPFVEEKPERGAFPTVIDHDQAFILLIHKNLRDDYAHKNGSIFGKLAKGEGDGGVISDPKNFVADFSVILRGKSNEFSGKGGGVTPIPKISILAPPEKAQHSFAKQ